jgi:superfamily II DNA helicase RecQ
VLIATDATGMGIDIHNIKFIIQWGVSRILNYLSLFRCGGRGVRDGELHANAILYYPRRLLLDEDTAAKSGFKDYLSPVSKDVSDMIKNDIKEWRAEKKKKQVAKY